MHINDLAARLIEASNAYYNQTPIMTDAEFDALEAELRQLSPSHPVLKKVGSPVAGEGWNKVSHPYPMGSLDKVQSIEEFKEWSKGKRSNFFVSEKMDGISILLTYKEGRLVSAVTRGDGAVGEDITRNVRIMGGVPHTIADDSTVYVRGEIVCTKDNFTNHFQGDSNPRNTASGTSKRQSGWEKCRYLTVYAYQITLGWGQAALKEAEFRTLDHLGFKTPCFYLADSAESVREIYEDYIKTRDSINYDIDGLVVEVNNTTEHHNLGTSPDGLRPKGAVAFKFPHDSKPSHLLDVVWQVGQSGRVTPVAVFEPVVLGGASVTHASLHNIANVDRLIAESGNQFLSKGELLLVSRRNDVIPYVEKVLTSGGTGEILNTPHRCPACESSLHMDGEYLVCRNTDECPAQILGGIRRWITKTGVLHFGEAMIEAVVEAGLVTSLGDLYRLDAADVAELKVDGRKIGGASTRAVASLHQNKNLTLDTFIGSLGIPMCGRRMVGMLVDAGFKTLQSLIDASVSDLAAVPNFGAIRAEAFRSGLDLRMNMVDDLLLAGVSIETPVETKPTSTKLQGVSVCFTGFRDGDLEDAILAAGGTIKSGVSKGLTYLVTKDPTSTSGKAQKARDIGTKVISPDEMKAMVN